MTDLDLTAAAALNVKLPALPTGCDIMYLLGFHFGVVAYHDMYEVEERGPDAEECPVGRAGYLAGYAQAQALAPLPLGYLMMDAMESQ